MRDRLVPIPTSEEMREQLAMLSLSVEGIEGRTTKTQSTLIANLSEYPMAMGSTSHYREYLQKLGVAPTSDVEPILEALPDGAIAVRRTGGSCTRTVSCPSAPASTPE